MSFSVVNYYVSVLRERSVNFKYSFDNLSIEEAFSRKFGTPHILFFSQFIPKQTHLTSLAMSVDML